MLGTGGQKETAKVSIPGYHRCRSTGLPALSSKGRRPFHTAFFLSSDEASSGGDENETTQ